MSSRIAYPFLTLPDGAVGFRGWMIGDPGEPLQPANDIFDGWDYERDLEVHTECRFNFERVADALGVTASDAVLRVTLKAGTGAGTLPRRLDRLATAVVSLGSPHAVLSGRILSGRASSRLRLECAVTLDAAPANSGTAFSPNIVGARLWAQRKDILLEDGGDSRFPIELVPFSTAFRGQPQESAPWYVHWRPGQFEADFGGSVRVYVNSQYEELAARFVDGDPLTLQAILGDVMSQMVAAATAVQDCDAILAHCEDGTVGAQVRIWLQRAFPGQETAVVRSMLDTTPGRFRAALLGAAQLGDEP